MDKTQALQNLLNGTATEDEIDLLKGGLASGEISIGGNVNQSVIIIGSGNTVELPPAALDRLGGRSLLGDLDRDLTGDEIAIRLNHLETELPLRAPVLMAQLQEQTRRLRPTLKTNPKSLSDHARMERVEALAQVNSLCMEALDISFNALCLGEEPPEYDSRSPFRGLESFRPEDSEFFFGREALTKKLVDKIKSHSFLAVIGSSGSGKSSLVMAGLIPALGGEYIIFRPGTNPLEALETVKENALVVVDQFEELFTLTRDEGTRKEFITKLLETTKRNKVVITLRSDFLGEVGAYRSLKEEIQSHLEIVSPMDMDELRRAMEGQANQVGLRFEADLSQQILDDVEGEPGAMPLLQHALWELWNRRHGRNLRASEYRAFGGVKQAITSTAEKVYGQCIIAEQDQIRDIFLRLTRLDEGDEGRDTRRRVPLTDLIPSGRDTASITVLLNKLANARLIVKMVNEDKTEVEVAHEALIHHWERLRLWLNEDREGLHLHQHLSDSAHQWEKRGREVGELYRSSRLTQAQEWRKIANALLSPLEEDFLKASQKVKQRELLRWVSIAGVGAALLLIVVLAMTDQLNRYIYQPVDMEDYWVTIPAGEFQMGRDNNFWNEYYDESPINTVYLDAFEIGQYEVTNRQYAQCMRAGICIGISDIGENREVYPVVDVSWYAAQTFCNWVGGRLPTEAEWEKAARGDLEAKAYPWGDEEPICTNDAPNGANIFNSYLVPPESCPNDAITIGSFSPNGYGLYDMSGNVWEWVNDWYEEAYYDYSPPANPTGPESGTLRVLRGGSFDREKVSARVSFRYSLPSVGFSGDIGFRCARNIPTGDSP